MGWKQGRPKPSLKEDILELLRENDDRPFMLSTIRGELYPELSWPSDVNAGSEVEKITIISRTATIHALLEDLVDEAKVEKRAFITDSIDMITVNEEEYNEVLEMVGDENVESEKIFYRASTE